MLRVLEHPISNECVFSAGVPLNADPALNRSSNSTLLCGAKFAAVFSVRLKVGVVNVFCALRAPFLCLSTPIAKILEPLLNTVLNLHILMTQLAWFTTIVSHFVL